MNDLKLETVVCRSSDVITREMDGHIVFLTPERGMIHELDETGTAIWSLCDKPISIKELAAEIVTEYDVDSGRAEKDILAFLGDLIGLGVIITT